MAEKTIIAWVYLTAIACLVSIAVANYGSFEEQETFFKQRLDIELDKHCIQHKVDGAAYHAMVEDLGVCEHDLYEQVRRFSGVEAVDEYIKGFCGNPNAKICAKIAEETLRPCLSDIQRYHLRLKANFYQGSRDYACQMDGKPIKDVLDNRGGPCPDELREKLQDCMRYLYEISFEKLEHRFSEANCRKVLTGMECIANLDGKRCSEDVIYKFLSQSSTAGFRATPCKSVIDGPTSERLADAINQKLDAKIIDKSCIEEKKLDTDVDKILNELNTCENNISDLISVVKTVEDIDEYVKSYCGKKHAKSCAKVILHNFKQCLSQGQQDYLHHTSAYNDKTKEYACQMNGKPIKDVLDSRGVPCSRELRDKLQDCMHYPSEISFDKLENRFTEANCRKVLTGMECIANLDGKRCSEDVIYKFLSQSSTAGFRATPCKSVIDGRANERIADAINQKLDANVIDKSCIEEKKLDVDVDKILNELNTCENNISDLISVVKTVDGIDEYIKNYCGKKHAKSCAKIIWHNFKPCLSQGQQDYLQHTSAYNDKTKEYACQMDGKPLKNINKMNGLKCPHGIAAEKRKCMVYESKVLSEKVEQRFSEENCRRLKEFVQCSANTHKMCEDDDMSTFVLQSNFAGLKATPCKILFDEFTTTTTTTTTSRPNSASISSSVIYLSSALITVIFLFVSLHISQF